MAAHASRALDTAGLNEDARNRLVSALRAAVDVLRDDEPVVLPKLVDHLEADGADPALPLERQLAAFAAANADARVPLADVLGLAARGLAPRGRPPRDAAGAAAWRATLTAVAGLYESGSRRLGRLPFVDDDRLALLLAESRQAHRRTIAVAQQIADPGPVLRELAVDRRLAAAVSDAFGSRVDPTYRAVYMDFAPGAHVEPHVDHADYEVIVHLTLAHTRPASGGRRAALVVFRVDRPAARIELAPGEAVALRGRGSIHAREPLGPGEHWATLAIGFRPVEPRR